MSDFKPGDVVELMSGGPAMTIDLIEGYTTGQRAICVWFVNMQDRKEALFSLETLKKYKSQY